MSDLRKALRPAAEKLVEAFVDRLVAEVESQISRAQEQALASFEAALARKEAPAVAPPEKHPAKRARAKAKSKEREPSKPSVERDTKPAKAGARGPYKCRICGELGKRADGCGTTHNVGGATSTPLSERAKQVAPINGTSKRDDILARARARDAGAARS